MYGELSKPNILLIHDRKLHEATVEETLRLRLRFCAPASAAVTQKSIRAPRTKRGFFDVWMSAP